MMTNSIMGTAPSAGSLETVFKLLAEDPNGFQAKIKEYQDAADRAEKTLALLAQADQIPGLFQQATDDAAEANRVKITAQSEATKIVEDARIEANDLIHAAQSEAAIKKSESDEINLLVDQARQDLASIRRVMAVEAKDHEDRMAKDRAAIEAAHEDLAKAQERAVSAERLAIELQDTIKAKIERINAIALE